MNKPSRVTIALVLGMAAAFLFLTTLGGWLQLVRHFHCDRGNDGLFCQACGLLQYALYIGAIVIVPLLIGLIAWFFYRLLAPPSAGGGRPGGVVLGAVLLGYLALIGIAGFAMTLALDMPTANNALRIFTSVLLAFASGVAACGLWQLNPGGRWLAVAVLAVSIPLTAYGLLSWAATFSLRQASSYLLMFVMETSLLIYLIRPSVAHAFRASSGPDRLAPG